MSVFQHGLVFLLYSAAVFGIGVVLGMFVEKLIERD